MGVLPLEFANGQTWHSLELSGEEQFDIEGLDEDLKPRGTVMVVAKWTDGDVKRFEASVRIDTSVEMDYFRNGGILPSVLRKLLTS
jgi:aconitate hydratase